MHRATVTRGWLPIRSQTIADQSSRGELLVELIFIPGEHTTASAPTTPRSSSSSSRISLPAIPRKSAILAFEDDDDNPLNNASTSLHTKYALLYICSFML